MNGIPATSIEGLRLGQVELGAKAPNQVVLFDRLMDSAPPGRESNWVETVPAEGWFIALRLYGPTEAWFNGAWRPGEIVKQP